MLCVQYTAGNKLDEAFMESKDSDFAQNLSEGICESNTTEHVDKESQTFKFLTVQEMYGQSYLDHWYSTVQRNLKHARRQLESSIYKNII